MNEKTKTSLKKALVYIIIFAVGIATGIFAVKSGFEYKGLEATAKRLSLNTNMQLNKITLAGLDDPEALYEALYNECLYLEIIDRTGYWFLNKDDALDEEDFTRLYNTFIEARDLSKKLAEGEQLSDEDLLWLEVFINTVHSSFSGSRHYQIFIDRFY
ncbi:MAG: hypothetical protein IJO01_00675 [Oscillospiraceae bacterium]|nr:hypothetical protein [Oscillospiraceae bacterium]